MYEVFVVACLIAHPGTCKTFELRMQEYASLPSCSQRGFLDVTQWGTHKTEWRIKKWVCAHKGESI